MNRFLERNNRERYFKSADIDPRRVVTADLVHGVRTRRVFGEAAGTMIAGTDGLVTNKENLFLSATAADCFLLYLYDSERNTIGITHVGWRGLLGGVVENAIDVLAESFGVSPQDLFVGISPGIRRCHFEVSPADRKKFQEYADFIFEDGGRIFVDLPGIIMNKLQCGGVSAGHVEDSNKCTYCNGHKYFSYRRDKPKKIETQVGYIGLV